jgi:UDP-N-acetyl-D-glucosamine/UDP-N-acetyl-D-galactosamine dehydrogenase
LGSGFSGMTSQLCVIGLGYVGLPLAVALARHFPVVGFDIDAGRIDELRRGHDRTREVEPKALSASKLVLTNDPQAITARDIYIITVPTPVDAANRPDLGAVRQACQLVGKVLKQGSIVVLESTVYPGVTEDICGPELEAASGLVCGRDFFLGYSPERINPGDRQHTVERITKVVSGQTPEVAQKLAAVYGAITAGGTFVARSIKAAEAAKVIENAQRDINIAFVNEVTVIFNKLGLSIQDVLDASRTKWNFLPFTPGLVGGHCIGVDPYYLADAAQKLGHHPEVILAGRRINDAMGRYIADSLARLLAKQGRSSAARILVLGLTFKENVPDLRNSKVIDVVRGLEEWGHRVDVHDFHADAETAKEHYGINLLPHLDGAADYHCVVGAVAHDEYASLSGGRLRDFVTADGIVADIKGMWRGVTLPDGVSRWQL